MGLLESLAALTMTDALLQPSQASRVPWRSVVAVTCMLGHGMFGYPLLPSSHYNDFEGYLPVFTLLALAVGFGLSALRAGGKFDRLVGTAVFIISLLYFAMAVRRMVWLWYEWERP